jgi:hypothetical protein
MELIDSTRSIDSRDAQRQRIVERECKKAGFKAKIRAFCCHCIYDPYSDGTWLKQVENCTSSHCPLFTVRPVPSSNKEAIGNG